MTIETWSSAPEAILLRARGLLASRRRVLVGISGPVGSGKTTLAAKISECIISTDSYLPDYDLVPYLERDDPAHCDLSRLGDDLALLRTGVDAKIPVWSFKSHRREGERVVRPSSIMVCEGIHALHETVREHLDLSIYVDAPPEDRWERWAKIERSGERGWGVAAARAYFDQVAEPTFHARASEYRAAAHIIVLNPLNEVAESGGSTFTSRSNGGQERACPNRPPRS